MKQIILVAFLLLSFKSASAADVPRRSFLAALGCPLMFGFDASKQDGEKYGLDWFARTQADLAVDVDLISKQGTTRLYEEFRWTIWQQIQQAAAESPNASELVVNASYIIVAEDGHRVELNPVLHVTVGGDFEDPQRGRERLITKIVVIPSVPSVF